MALLHDPLIRNQNIGNIYACHRSGLCSPIPFVYGKTELRFKWLSHLRAQFLRPGPRSMKALRNPTGMYGGKPVILKI